jgi:myo-inositol-1(or 4)-monophosphatase
MIRSPLMTVMTDAASKAARVLIRDFGEVENLQVSRKGPGDFVTKADRKAEEILRDILEKARPGYGFVCEESGVNVGADKTHTWHIDPLDGTTNFTHGIPHFALSIALEREGQIVAGVVYDPIKDEMFIAERGQGAYVNNRRIRVSGRKHLADCVIATGSPHLGKSGHGVFLKEMSAMMIRTAGVRRMGAASLDLAYVAAGRCDVYWERDLSSWDIAAGMVLVREAGGFVTRIGSSDTPLTSGETKIASVVCGNETIHRELQDVLGKD